VQERRASELAAAVGGNAKPASHTQASIKPKAKKTQQANNNNNNNNNVIVTMNKDKTPIKCAVTAAWG